MLWTLDHLDDLDADFRVFYRIDGIGDERFPPGMTAPRFFALAHRSSAYEGCMAARVMAEQQEKEPAATGRPEPPQRAGRVEEVDSSQAVLAAHPAFAGLIDF